MTLTRRAAIAQSAAATAAWLTGGCSADADAGTGTGTGPGTGTRPRQTELLGHAPRTHAVVVALDLDVSGPQPVAGAVRRLADRADAAGAPVLLGLGASLFDRADLTDRRPRQLGAMPRFPGDLLNAQRRHGDLLLEVGADSAADAERALGAVAGGLPIRWRVDGFLEGARIEHERPVATNLFGFVEGHGNPARPAVDDVVRVDGAQGEPAWAIGGSYQVARIIQFATALWDRDPIAEQEQLIGRRRDGRWLDGTAAHGEPAFHADPHGKLTPLESHVRRANPRGGPPPPMLRRGYSYRAQQGGRDEAGLLFMAYQKDLEAGFETVQRRLAGERLGRYALTVGGGYFFVPPPTAWVEGLFS